MKLIKMLVGALISVGMIVGATNVASADSARQSLSSDSVLEQIKKRGTLRIGLSTFVPWAMRDKKGEMIGYEIDVANKFAKASGRKLALKPMECDGLIPALLAGKVDILIAGMNSTVKRAQTVAFSIKYEEKNGELGHICLFRSFFTGVP